MPWLRRSKARTRSGRRTFSNLTTWHPYPLLVVGVGLLCGCEFERDSALPSATQGQVSVAPPELQKAAAAPAPLWLHNGFSPDPAQVTGRYQADCASPEAPLSPHQIKKAIELHLEDAFAELTVSVAPAATSCVTIFRRASPGGSWTVEATTGAGSPSLRREWRPGMYLAVVGRRERRTDSYVLSVSEFGMSTNR